MRTFYFKARNIGPEKYLTYTMGEETELDEDVLDYCEENNVKELIDIIYEEDDDYDYLTYDITDKKSLSELISEEISGEQALFIVRNVAGNLISIKEQAIHLSYILLNREYVYVGDNNDIFFICVPIENKGSLSVEFKGFLRQLLANMKYNVDEDLNYVGKLLTYINSDSFNLRGLIGLTEALMEEAGIDYDEAGTIEAEGVEVVSTKPEEEVKPESSVTDFMSDADDVPLPEIGDDEEEEPEKVSEDVQKEDSEELESILPAGMKIEETSKKESEDSASEKAEPAEPVAEAKEPAMEDVVPDIKEDTASEAPDKAETPADVEKAENAIEDIDKVSEAQEKETIEAQSADKEPEHIPEIAVENVIEPAPEENSDEKPKQEKKETPESEAKLEFISEPEAVKSAPAKKEEDLDVIKNKIKQLVGDVPQAKTTNDDSKTVKTLEDLSNMLDAGKNTPKKNVVKVNRAAIIQSIAEHEAETAELSEEELENAKSEHRDEPVENEKPAEAQKVNTLLNAPKAMPYLIRVNTEERIMLNKATFKIGKASRGVDYSVSGNGAVSRQHAVITQKDGVCYIKDNKSTNHTYVNDKEVEEGKEEILTHDSIIRLGDEEFLFKIR